MTDKPCGQIDDDIYRLYRPEWVIVYVKCAVDDRDDCQRLRADVQEHFDTFFEGRVRDEDVRILCSGTGIHAMAQLQLRLPNLKGEFKHAFLAQRHADIQGYDDFHVVARDSPADHELRGYSVRKLPT